MRFGLVSCVFVFFFFSFISARRPFDSLFGRCARTACRARYIALMIMRTFVFMCGYASSRVYGIRSLIYIYAGRCVL